MTPDPSHAPGECPVCRGTALRQVAVVAGYRLVGCAGCALVWVPGVSEEELSRFYGGAYYEGGGTGYADYLRDEPNLRAAARTLLAELPPPVAPGDRLLDVGCAHGFLLDEARRLGYRVFGVEISAHAHAHATGKLGLDVFLGDLAAAPFPDGTFAAATIVGSIEHLRDPGATVARLARLLRPGGHLVITTIDTAGPIRIYRYKPPEHLFYFSAANLQRLCRNHGLAPVACGLHWKKYRLSEALRLLGMALAPRLPWERLDRVPGLGLTLTLPTNEMQLVVRKDAPGGGAG